MLSSFAFPEPHLKSTDINNNDNNSKKHHNKIHRKKYIDETTSVHELTDLIGRLTAQLEKLETSKTEKSFAFNNNEQKQQHPQQQSNNNNSNGSNKKRVVINPLAADVTQSYEKLLLQNEYLQESIMGHRCGCCSCATSTIKTSKASSVNDDITIVEAAPGIPWFSPYISSSLISSDSGNSNNALSNDDPLHSAYAHWCTLMRCLPSMDPEAQYYIRTIGHYAMRQLLHSMRNCNSDYNTITTINNGSATSKLYNSSKNINSNNSRASSMMLATTPSSPPLSGIQRYSNYHGSSNTLLSSRTAGMGSSSHPGLNTSHAGSSTLLAQHSSLLKTSSTCLNDMIQHSHSHPHPVNQYSHQESNGSMLCKADGWVPSRSMMSENPSYLYHHHRHNNQGQFRASYNQGDEHGPPPSSPPSQLVHQQQQSVANTESTSPIPTSSNRLFSSPLMQHITRPYHSTKFRRWFKRHNKVSPVVNGNH
ncbi:hypothetical protein BDC45DRAFT_568519 [Circinella umbellata]|nr:hypothetical protein BDC45DRAFT_568519 [Circinella umbellata]